MNYDVIIVGSGAGGSAAAYQLTQTGKRVLLVERGLALPRDGTTLDVDKVLRRGIFQSGDPWADGRGKTVVPTEFANLGGKTKWYGAALLRFSPHEFLGDEVHRCPPWPITYEDLEPFYEEAERLLEVRHFPIEPDLQKIVSGLRRLDPDWRKTPLPVGLSADILSYPNEARHFDGFASPRGLKADAEKALLERVSNKPNLHIVTGKAVIHLKASDHGAKRVAGVVCEDGTEYLGDTVLLAAGALHSPRLLQAYLQSSGLAATLPAYAAVGRHYKCHLNSAVMAFSPRSKTDVLRKTVLLLNEKFPHSSVQNLGWMDGEILGTQLPRFVPRWCADLVARRAYGFWVTTEDGTHFDNRVAEAEKAGTAAGAGARPVLDYDKGRTPAALNEHTRLLRSLRGQLLRLGYVTAVKNMPLEATAHACGTLAAGSDPSRSVVDGNGKVHGMDNVYVVDGSALTRSSRVNPALTIYAWALRVTSRLESKGRGHEYSVARTDTIRA